MNLARNSSELAARAAYLEFLESFLPADYDTDRDRYRHDTTLALAYQRAAFDEGWLMPHWEPGLGGRGLNVMEALEVRLAGAERGAPQLPNIQGPNVVAPMIRRYGSPAQRMRYLVPLLRGDERWALGMSEPGAGSDFAALTTRADPRSGGWSITGQKIWTSHAAESAFAAVWCRTDPAAARHRGISCFIVDLSAHGVLVRPIAMAAGTDDRFCEVFFDAVAVADADLLGPLHGGWGVAMESLTEERSMIWVMNWAHLHLAVSRLASLAPSGDADGLWADIGRSMADAEALRFLGLSCAEAGASGQDPPVGLALKLMGSEALQRAWQLVLEASAPTGGPGTGDLDGALDSLGATIYGGTSEIQRRIVAERALGLPRP